MKRDYAEKHLISLDFTPNALASSEPLRDGYETLSATTFILHVG